MQISVEIEYDEQVYIVEGEYTPATPAPTVGNPDAPGYSDPGAGSEFWITQVSVEPEGPVAPQRFIELRSSVKFNDLALEAADAKFACMERAR